MSFEGVNPKPVLDIPQILKENGFVIKVTPGMRAEQLEGEINYSGFEQLSDTNNPRRLPDGRIITNGKERLELAVAACRRYLAAPMIADDIKDHPERKAKRDSIQKDPRFAHAAADIHHFFHTNKLSKNFLSGCIGDIMLFVEGLDMNFDVVNSLRSQGVRRGTEKFFRLKDVVNTEYMTMSLPDKKLLIKEIDKEMKKFLKFMLKPAAL